VNRAHSSRDSATIAGAAAVARLLHGVRQARAYGGAVGHGKESARHGLTSLEIRWSSWLHYITPHGATHARIGRGGLPILAMWVGLLKPSLCIELGVLRGISELAAKRVRVIEIHCRQSLATLHNSV
jgi:hypothetical protein